MSVDPFVHGGSQGINPYSYIMNNPLAGTDPSGYEPEVATKEMMIAATGSNIKHKVTATVTQNEDGSATVTFTGKNANAVKSTKMAATDALTNKKFDVKDLGSPQQISQIDDVKVRSGEREGGTNVEPFKVSTTIDKEKADDIDIKGLDITNRMVDMTERAIERSGDEALQEEMNNTEFIYDPTHKVFKKNPDVVAFRFANEKSTTIYVGRKIVEVSDPNIRFPYHGTRIRGGDTGLLFVGLHEFGHVVGRQNAKKWTSTRKELFANSFAKKHYPRRLSGTKVNRKDIKFARGTN